MAKRAIWAGAFVLAFQGAFAAPGKARQASARRSGPSAESPRSEGRAAFAALLDAYRKQDRPAFMALVSERFNGGREALEEGLERDFADMAGVEILPVVRRVKSSGGLRIVEFSFTRRFQSRLTGKASIDKGRSRVIFVNEAGSWKLKAMAEPLLFAVSAAGEAATLDRDKRR